MFLWVADSNYFGCTNNCYMKNRSTSYVSASILVVLITAGLANAQNTITVSGAGTSAVNGTYTYGGMSAGYPYYNNGIYRLEYRYYEWEIWNTTLSGYSAVMYYEWLGSTTPLSGYWDWYNGVTPVPTISNQVAFTNGSSYTVPAPVRGANNNPIGRFFLDPGIDGNITAATVQFSGTPTGITAVKLWSSADATFSSASDVQLSSKAYASSVTFNGFTSTMNISGTYYFITADLSSGATGSVSTTIANSSAFAISSGSVITSITNATLSSAAVPLPIRLLSFTAQSKPDAVTLQWSTDREENFKGFDIERSADGSAWTKMAFVASLANYATVTTHYSYTDNTPVTGHVYYRLKMVDADGTFKYSKQLTVIKNTQHASLQNYPNPFRGNTNIAFQLPVTGLAALKVFNTMGAEVSTLINKKLEAGTYTVSFDGASLPAGVYHYTLLYGKEKLSGTMLLK